ncbi:major royal jelly protein 1-like [Bradysia coprophila]|uniref:major royal jelly protein 1-like n=1 Tax=Bradysia coprophila TaxID=38358 RepID=UPI00187DC0A1|nr:major royal jelly protein 1-like [Bradysia coprophila]XP_037026150.1 major royal jelly protein 1-like [Bradysia coprophila]XP_037026151.1 major royal jelly protein 1-like [Bradysia coprophila]XP_037026152.1 major royal jelly protein 1-like [Bradysia coprophila]
MKMPTKTSSVVLLLILMLSKISTQQLVSLKQLAEWKELEFEFPSPNIRENAILNNGYIPGNSVPIDVDIDYRDHAASRVFVTIPRFTIGVPITLGTVTSKYGPNGPLIQAYPDYNWHSSHGRNCDGLTSVFRVAIDECRRLWILDSGRIGDNQLCAPQIVVFDLNTDLLIHRYKFPDNVYKPGVSLFITPVVDVRDPGPLGACANTMVYIADVNGFGVIVYDYRRNVAWRTQNKYFYPNPDNGTFTIRGESFDLMDGVLGMALSRKSPVPRAFGFHHTLASTPSIASDRYLFFHSLASITENRVALNVLDNQTAWNQNPDHSPRSFVKLGSRVSQSAAQAMDKNGNLFFGLMDPIGVACWDSSKPYTRNNMRLVTQNDEKLQFASGMKVVLNRKNKEELWVLTCSLQRVMTGSISSKVVNFRVQAIQIDELLSGSECTRAGIEMGSSISFPVY